MIKSLCNGLALVLVSPLLVIYRLSALLLPTRRDAFFRGQSEFLSLFPGFAGVYLRRAFYRRTLWRCAADCWIGFGTLLFTPEVEIGDHVYIGPHCMLGHVSIGADSLLGSRVDVLSGKHQHNSERLDVPIRLQGGRYDRIRIGTDVWIGNGATIMADVDAQAIVAAASVVIREVAARSIVAGNPAREVRQRTAAGATAG